MKLFLDDLWADLREKRLWPVALLLLVGLIAVPLVVAKPASEPDVEAPSAQVAEPRPGEGVEVLAADETTTGSALDLFDPKNPFRPPESILAADDAPSSTASSSQTPAGASDSGAGAGSGDTGGSAGGDAGDFSVPGGGGGSPSPPRRTVEQYTYVIDATFWRGDNRRRVRGMARLEMLPNDRSPLLIFLGVDASASNAVFLVDSSLDNAGEGSCKPSNEECSFLYLGSGSVHQFTNDDGDSYAIRVDQIRRVRVRAVSSSADGETRRESKRDETETGGSDGDSGASARSGSFVPQIFADLVSTTGASGSKSGRNRR